MTILTISIDLVNLVNLVMHFFYLSRARSFIVVI